MPSCCFCYTASPTQYHKHSLHNFCKQPQQPDFHFKISGILAAIKLTDKSGYPDNGYPDMQTLCPANFSYIRVLYSTLPTPNLLIEWQCTFGKFIRLPNRIESKLFLARIGMLYTRGDQVLQLPTLVLIRRSKLYSLYVLMPINTFFSNRVIQSWNSLPATPAFPLNIFIHSHQTIFHL